MVRKAGLAIGAGALLVTTFAPTPEGLSREGFIVAGLVVLMMLIQKCFSHRLVPHELQR